MTLTASLNIGKKSDRYGSCLARTKAAFLEIRDQASFDQRAADIAALPAVEWKGRTLRAITCHADFGNGPHVVNVPEYVLWSLIDLRAFRCPYH